LNKIYTIMIVITLARFVGRVLRGKETGFPMHLFPYSTSKHEWESGDMPIFQYTSGKRRKGKRLLYGWGHASMGELGIKEFLLPKNHLHSLTHTVKPFLVPFGSKNNVIGIACGVGFSLFICRERGTKLTAAYGTGLNTYSQLSSQPHSPNNHTMRCVVEPKVLPLPLSYPEKTKVTHVSCGRAHSLVATDKEGVFSLGSNEHGQCGRPVILNEDYQRSGMVHHIRDLPTDVKQMVCGFDYSLVLDSEGHVYAFGFGYGGQLGNGTAKSNWKPGIIEGDIKDERIVQISSAGDCVLALSDKGDVFGWGNSEFRQLGTSSKQTQVNLPRHLDLKIGRVKEIACSGSSCAALTADTKLFVWGYGPLGLGPKTRFTPQPMLLPSTLFGENAFEPEVHPVRVFGGISHFAVINSKADLYMWGRNECGFLGLGHNKEQFFPFKVSINCNVQEVSCGPFHTLALCRTWILISKYAHLFIWQWETEYLTFASSERSFFFNLTASKSFNSFISDLYFNMFVCDSPIHFTIAACLISYAFRS
ncbi:Williams-Beuren syndrome chromosomal region 16 -like protein, partial [Trichinella britovi]